MRIHIDTEAKRISVDGVVVGFDYLKQLLEKETCMSGKVWPDKTISQKSAFFVKDTVGPYQEWQKRFGLTNLADKDWHDS